MDVTPLKKNLQVEELKTGSAASESTMQRVGSSVNFWNSFYEGSRGWFANGPYSWKPVPQTGIDGAAFANCNMEIWEVGAYNLVAGSSGDIEFDIIRHPVGGGPGVSIFSTRPKIPSSAGNNARLLQDTLLNTNIYQSIGVQLPVLTSSNLDAGDFLTCTIVNVQDGGESAGIILAVRPR